MFGESPSAWIQSKMNRQQRRAGAKSNASASVVPLLELGIAHFNAGRITDAENCFRQVLVISPANPDALHLLGAVAIATRQYRAGVDLISKAIRHNPTNADFHANLGAAYSALGELPEALASFKRALNLKPNSSAALKNRGNVFVRLRKFSEAIADFEAAISLKPDFAEAYNDLGYALFLDAQLEAANEILRKVLRIAPCYDAALNNLRKVLFRLKRPEEVLPLIDNALSLSPQIADLHNTKGLALKEIERFDEALACFDRAIAIKPEFTRAHINRGTCFEGMARYGEVAGNYRTALSIDPGDPDAHWNLAINSLRLGDFSAGWVEYEWRWKCDSLNFSDQRFEKPPWLGKEPIAGKVLLLHNEQGFGDALQFCRYIPLLKNLGADVILEIDPPLKSLLSQLPGVSHCIARGDPLPRFDFHCPVTSLPLAFSTTLETIPSQVPYLPPVNDNTGELVDLSRLPRIGIVWSGNPNHANDHNRSLPFKALLPLLDGVEAQFYSLQKHTRSEDEALLRQRADVLDLGPKLLDFSYTAAAIQQLDLVISADTGVAHLAGGLGRPIWILLPFIPEWRWMLDREDSPWYPTARLFRQGATRDWAPVIERVREALIERMAQPRSQPL
jgi:tetratricopeptide (TPR) repeat protein